MGHGYTGQIRDSLIDDIPDHRIIATAIWLRDNNPDRKVILVTKDLNKPPPSGCGTTTLTAR